MFKKAFILSTLFIANLCAVVDFTEQAKEPGAVIFTPPQGWNVADKSKLPPSVLVMIVGKGAHEMPPSIHLTTEEYKGTLKEYMEIVKQINRSKGNDWKDLGTLNTEAGPASLSQADMKTEWGDVRMMHAILLRDGIVYNLTAASLKSEFSKFYKDFFQALRSLKINS